MIFIKFWNLEGKNIQLLGMIRMNITNSQDQTQMSF